MVGVEQRTTKASCKKMLHTMVQQSCAFCFTTRSHMGRCRIGTQVSPDSVHRMSLFKQIVTVTVFILSLWLSKPDLEYDYGRRKVIDECLCSWAVFDTIAPLVRITIAAAPYSYEIANET